MWLLAHLTPSALEQMIHRPKAGLLTLLRSLVQIYAWSISVFPVPMYMMLCLDLLLSRLQLSAPHVHILVANVPDITFLPRFQSADAVVLHRQIAAYNSVIAATVKRHHVLLVNLYARWHELANHPEYISDDGFHPNAIGYTRIAEIFYQVLQENSLT